MGTASQKDAKQDDPHIQESTLPVALAKVRAEMPDVPNFTIHDFRRTARTHLAALGVDP
jgi:integrase